MINLLKNMIEKNHHPHSPHSSSSESLGKDVRLVKVLGEDGGSEAVRCVIGAVNHLLHLTELQDLLNWPKDLWRGILNTN